ncbi:MAG: redox-sensing transcriptional repressor Rex [Dehalococcoidia bacterium]|nr:redox-sensing transcriptional repressor Rex [Dehalococcoidia bacterium]
MPVPLEIPDVVIDRLPVYYRLLSRLASEGRAVVSSQELGDELGVTPAQIRKDLSYFGRFGKQGRGYSVNRLAEELRVILGLNTRWSVVVVGLGRLGRAISSYPGFSSQGFDIVARYDASPDIVGTEIDGELVRSAGDIESDLRQHAVDIGIVAVPAEAAQEVVDLLVRGGVRAILNYAPTRVVVPEGVELKHINPVLFLQSMTYHLKRGVIERDRVSLTSNGDHES